MRILKNISKQGRFIPHVNEGDFSPAMLKRCQIGDVFLLYVHQKNPTMKKRFSTSVRFKEGMSLPWYAYITDNLTHVSFSNTYETEEQAHQWIQWAKQTCEKGRKTPEGWVLN